HGSSVAICRGLPVLRAAAERTTTSMRHRQLLPEDPLELFLSENDVLMPRTVPTGEEPQGSTGVPDFQLPASEALETLTGAAVLAVLASSLFMLAPPQPVRRPPL